MEKSVNLKFDYELPGGLHSHSYFKDNKIRFDPPVYEQRYTTAVRILEDPVWNTHFKKILDLGCADYRLFPLIRRIEFVEHILEVDIDEHSLAINKRRVDPLITDYLSKRKTPLLVEVYAGNAREYSECFRGVDAIICLELIEHMYSDDLLKLPANIFGLIQPKIAIFSTPNADCNIVFGEMQYNGFRHPDHKFEWKRCEFEKWALDICDKYRNYKVAFIGAGNLPPTFKHLGHVTQIAIFARLDILDGAIKLPMLTDYVQKNETNPTAISDIEQRDEPLLENDEINKKDENSTAASGQDEKTTVVDEELVGNELQDEGMPAYKKIYSVTYPFVEEKTTKEEKIFAETWSYITRNRTRQKYYKFELSCYLLPLKPLIDGLKMELNMSEEEILKVVKKDNITIKDDEYIELSVYEDESGMGKEDLFGVEHEESSDESVESFEDDGYVMSENWD